MACRPEEALRNPEGHLGGEYGVRRYLERVGYSVLILFGSVVVAAALVASSIGLNALVGLAFGEDSQTHRLFRLISSVFLIGAGLVIAAGGAIVVAMETLSSVIDYYRVYPRKRRS